MSIIMVDLHHQTELYDMKSVLFCLFAILLSGRLVAQDTLAGPNGGKLKTAGFYRMEVVECYEYLEVFVYELDMTPVGNRGLNGTVDFNFPDGTCQSSKLYPYAMYGFTADIKKQCFTDCQITIHGIGISVTAAFSGFGETNEDCHRPGASSIPAKAPR